MSYARTLKRLLPLGVQPTARYWFEHWTGREERELSFAASLVRPGDVAIDVGANFGVYAHALARRGAMVHAFEPQPACVEVLRAYASRPRNVHVYDVALSAEPGRATLHVPRVGGRPMRGAASIAHGSSDEDSVEVTVRTLDSYGLENVAFMKIDVEGAELEVIRGGERTLAASRPALLVEIEQRHRSGGIDKAFAAITGLGYLGAFLDGDRRLHPLGDFDPAVHQVVEPGGRPGGLYVFNFFFFPEDSSRFDRLTSKLLPGGRARG